MTRLAATLPVHASPPTVPARDRRPRRRARRARLPRLRARLRAERERAPAAPRSCGSQQVASGLDSPLHVAAPRNERGRVYIVLQDGKIVVLENGRIREQPFLDIDSQVTSGGEQGLLSVAFHPRYAQNRLFYVNYTDNNGHTRVVEYRSDGRRRSSACGSCSSSSSRTRTTTAARSRSGPTAGCTSGTGDGGAGGDPENRAQNTGSRLGKLLALNVNKRGAKWQIVGDRAAQPVALLVRPRHRRALHRRRRPGRLGGDRLHARGSSPGLENYGWDVYEGRASFEQKELGPGRLRQPVHVYDRDNGCSVSGGFVYRGAAVSSARGRYFFGDYCSGRVWSLKVVGGRARGVRLEALPRRRALLVRRGRHRRALPDLARRLRLPARALSRRRAASGCPRAIRSTSPTTTRSGACRSTASGSCSSCSRSRARRPGSPGRRSCASARATARPSRASTPSGSPASRRA